jgi:hypothetical protein
MGNKVKFAGRILSPGRPVIMWETVRAIGSNIKSYRHKVLGGWIVRTFKTAENDTAEKLVFLSDPNHKWKMYMKESFNPVTEEL